MPAACSRLPATREGNVAPGRVTIGAPARARRSRSYGRRRRGVEHEIGELQAPEMLRQIGAKSAARRSTPRFHASLRRLPSASRAASSQSTLLARREQTAPDVEYLRRELEGLIEAAEDEAFFRQPALARRLGATPRRRRAADSCWADRRRISNNPRRYRAACTRRR